MVSRNYDRYYLTCDVCDTDADQEFDEFAEAVEFKRENGWRSRKTAGHWEDLCPDCSKEASRG